VTAPAQPSDPDPTAVVGRRFGAVAIDLGILWVFSAVYWILASEEEPGSSIFVNGPCTGRAVCSNLNERYVAGWPMVILTLVWFAYMVGVFVVQRGLTGRTIGTMLTGVVVVGPDGRPLGVGKALLRSVAGVVDYFPCCLPIVGFTTVLVTKGHRRVGDLAADSYVVGAEGFGLPVQLPGPPLPVQPPAPMPAGYPTQPPVPPAAQPPVAWAPQPTFTPPPPVMPHAGDRGPFRPPGAPDVGPIPPGGLGATPAPAPAPSGTEAVWDPERRAYLQWDPARQQWLQFDQASQRWQQYDAPSGRWRPVDG
jgi:uncharacterized RDD family membrane protein YckC